MISLIQPENSGSIAVALRLGMSFEGYTEVMGQPALMYALDRRTELREMRTAVRCSCRCLRRISKNTTISQNSVYPSQLSLDYTNPRLETE